MALARNGARWARYAVSPLTWAMHGVLKLQSNLDGSQKLPSHGRDREQDAAEHEPG